MPDALQPSSEPAPAAGVFGRFSPVTKFAVLTGCWLAVAAAFAAQLYALGLMPWSSAVALALLDWAPWIVVSPAVLWFARRLPIAPRTWTRSIPLHLLGSLLAVVAIEAGTRALVPHRELLFPAPRHQPPPPPRALPPPDGPFDSAWARLLERARIYVPVYWMLVAGAHAVAHQRRSLERERRALLAEAHLAEARLAALQAQLNPHFLFNTLNTIAQLVYDNPAAAEATITSLSELLRTALDAQRHREVPLEQELRFVERYAAIQKVRFSDRIDLCLAVTPEARHAAVPTLLLQPLVENAILHGLSPGRTPGLVFLRASVIGDRLRLEIADTGADGERDATPAGGALAFREGVGLSNTRARLAALYGERQSLTLTRAAEGGVAVRIELPWHLPA
jgi:two-component system, LytTR family, sensor kinase